MNKRRQLILISILALGLFALLKSLPDTQCALLHVAHQPILDRGLEFCGVNEEANFYSPKDLQFPVKAEIKFNQNDGELRLVKTDGKLFYDYEIAVSHTQKVHLHLKQNTGRTDYIHIHPVSDDSGVWHFKFPEEFLKGNPGGELQAYIDFVPLRSGRTILAEAKGTWSHESELLDRVSRNKIVSLTTNTNKTGESATLRFKLSSANVSSTLKLKPIMGALGHAVVFSTDLKKTGYAHMHPSLEGQEYELEPTLAFKLKLPGAGDYEIWININDGENDYLVAPLHVSN
ncbi:MAG: hypothetical protein WCP90_01905 [Opitutae bacterium]